jgi:mRNA-degrading endonuclease toxin of MazEF toxin-antitoxin module
MYIELGGIYFVCLDPVFGREFGGFQHHPAVVVSIPYINKNTRLITVVPGTSNDWGNHYENIVRVESTEDNGLDNTTYFQCHQIRAIERGRITGKAVGRLSRDDFNKIKRSVAHCLGLVFPD